MNVVPFIHEGLGNSSYLVELSGGEAALVDPDRSVGRYLQTAEARGWRIASVFETHLHADFVSGAREIAHATGASLSIPKESRVRFPHQGVKAGERIRVPGGEVEAIASPGHTPEHLSYMFRSGRQPPALFSGGALIAGGAARTDLISPETTNDLTRALYRTLKKAFADLPDETLLYPTHGGGSFCSVASRGERVSTLGRERAANPLLSLADEEEFVRWFPTTFPGAPAYFFRMRAFNQEGPRLRQEVAGPPALSTEGFDRARTGVLVVDVRPKEVYAAGHIPGSLSNPFRDAYALWLGWLVPPETLLLFVGDGVPIERVVEESLLVGYERFSGRLEGGIEAWAAAGKVVLESPLIDAREARRLHLDGAAFLDVRERSEVQSGRLEGAIDVPLGELAIRLDEIPGDRPIVAYCGHGERASTAVSILERAGRGPLLNLDGGIEAWKEAGYSLA